MSRENVTKAFVYEIEANSVDSHQVSPGYAITFVRFENRDTFRFKNSGNLETRKPITVVSDATELAFRDQKSSNNKSFECTLLGGDINYEAAVNPGDYVLVNMVENHEIVHDIVQAVNDSKAINTIKFGFKGLFRVQSVHRTVAQDAEGAMQLSYRISAYTHTELNDVIYFNPYMVTQGEKDNDVLFLTTISGGWNNLIADKQTNSVQNVIKVLFQAFLGRGFNQAGATLKEGLKRTENNLYLLPPGLGPLMGHPKAKYAADMTNMYLGIQQYSSTGANTSPEKGLNPIYKRDGTFVMTGQPLRGHSYARPEYWNQIPVHQIIKGYLNDVMNEMYTCLKPDPDTGSLMPAIVIRQKPFTTEAFSKDTKVTRFLSLPRWRINPNRIVNGYHIGKDDAARINMVQIFGRSQALQGNGKSAATDEQILKKNYVVDREDVKRNGLRPYIATSNFDYPSDGTSARLSQTPLWAQIVGDWVIGGQQKVSGTVDISGITEPITSGDNAQIDGVVFHIEGVTHMMSISRGDGKISFRTSLQLSSGVMSEAFASQGKYAEMNEVSGDGRRQWIADNGFETLMPMPGSSDTQDIGSRTDAEKKASFKDNPFSPEAKSINSKPKQPGKPKKGGK